MEQTLAIRSQRLGCFPALAPEENARLGHLAFFKDSDPTHLRRVSPQTGKGVSWIGD
jgi:hypothetical protein